MSFVIGKKTIKRRIEFEAEGDLGEKVPSSFVLTMLRPSKPTAKEFSKLFAEFADLLAKQQDDKSEDRISVVAFTEQVDIAEQKLADFVRSKIQDWDSVHDEFKNPLQFSDENLMDLFADIEARRAVFENYRELVAGRKSEAEKNLGNSADTGSAPSLQ